MSADAVLLIDLENMIGSRAKQAMMERKLDALLGHAGAGTPAVAACAGSAITDVGTQLLASRHVKLHKVGGAKDAGDKKLREEAASRAGQGDLSSCPSGAISRADASAARSRLAWGGLGSGTAVFRAGDASRGSCSARCLRSWGYRGWDTARCRNHTRGRCRAALASR